MILYSCNKRCTYLVDIISKSNTLYVLLFYIIVMELKDIIEHVEQKPFWRKATINELIKMPIEESKDRYALMLEIASYAESTWFPSFAIHPMVWWKPRLIEELYKAAQYIKNHKLLWSCLKNCLEILWQEFKDVNIKKNDFIKKPSWDEFQPLDLVLSDWTNKHISGKQEINKLWQEEVNFIFHNITENKYESFKEINTWIAMMWVKIEAIMEFYASWDVMNAPKFKECIEKKLLWWADQQTNED